MYFLKTFTFKKINTNSKSLKNHEKRNNELNIL